MMGMNSIEQLDSNLALLVQSCDKYSDVWDDFFNLRDRFWPDCTFKWYLATDAKPYNKEGVEVIHFGNIREWTTCMLKTLEKIKEPYVALFLEDAFIYKKIDNEIIKQDVQFVIDNKVDFLTLEKKPKFIPPEEYKYFAPHYVVIPKHQKYGVDTAAAIWNKNFLLELLSREVSDAWQFEINLCKLAATEEGLPGLILYDERGPFNISPVEVVRLGKIKPDAVKFFHNLGYDLQTQRPRLSKWQVLQEKLKVKLYYLKYGRKTLKRIGRLFGFQFLSED